MFEILSAFPFPFWVTIAVLIAGSVLAYRRVRDGSGVPTLAVLVTVAAWYIGDALYNDYAGYHAKVFAPGILESAWWQVAWFLVCFLIGTLWLHRQINGRHLGHGSGFLKIFKSGAGQPMLQRQLDLVFSGCVVIWITLAAVAAVRLQSEIPYYFFPFLGHKAEPWGRARIGTGFEALFTLAFYFQLLATGIFGVVGALSTHRHTRSLALLFCLLAFPYFIFDRTRNNMLAAVMPGILSWGLLRIRGGILRKFAVLGVCFVLINAWMGFVISNRSSASITTALKEKGFSLGSKEKIHHEGLNMYEELCWISTLMDRETFHPNWGSRYFAELVNIIPRPLWPGKPTIGIDYCIARGGGGGGDGQAGIFTSFSTGLIGQGVTNFGRFFGPAAAALLMSLWVTVLARLDLTIQKLGHLPLYGTGLILTFNLGRDITLITLYPFVFGCLTLWVFHRFRPAQMPRARHPRAVEMPQAAARIDRLPSLRGKARRPNLAERTTATRRKLPRNGLGASSNYL